MNKLLITSLLTLTFLLTSLSLAADTETVEVMPDNVPALLVKANSSYAAKDYLTYRKVLQRLRELRPNNSEYMYQLVLAHALLDEKTDAYNLMLSMQQQGLGYDFTLTDDSNNIRNTEVFDYINDLMIKAGEAMGESEVAFTLPDSIVLPEAMAWDESRQSFLIATAAQGSIHAVSQDGESRELLKADDENGMWAIFGLLVDQPRNRLWVSSAATRTFSGFEPADKGRSALFEFDLTSLELIRRYPVPVDGGPHVLGSMALSPNGDIFIVDRVLPIIYSKAANADKLKAVFASRDMISMRGIAIQPDGRLMYVADRELGIKVFDLESRKAGKVALPATLNVGGIDGLYLWDNHLIMIQNGINPERVMRLELDPSGTRVIAVRPLAVAQPEFDAPSFGTLKDKYLYYFANSQSTSGSGPARPVAVLRTAVDANADLDPPDMAEYLKILEEHQKRKAGNG